MCGRLVAYSIVTLVAGSMIFENLRGRFSGEIRPLSATAAAGVKVYDHGWPVPYLRHTEDVWSPYGPFRKLSVINLVLDIFVLGIVFCCTLFVCNRAVQRMHIIMRFRLWVLLLACAVVPPFMALIYHDASLGADSLSLVDLILALPLVFGGVCTIYCVALMICRWRLRRDTS